MTMKPTNRPADPVAVIYVRLPLSLKAAIVAEAERRGVSVNRLIVNLLSEEQ